MANGNERGDWWEIVKALEREAKGGCAKAITVTVFVDRSGRVVGRAEAKVVKLLPGNVMELIEQMMVG